jgi:peptidoglycan/LPS O-acetylase OafA/YrhL
MYPKTSTVLPTATQAIQSNHRKVIYFPGLNALRYIAAAMVVCCHVEEFKKNHLLPNLYDAPLVSVSGSTAVTFFFVLSGFLITYLLLKERDERETINVRNFYIRRVLRIWPVYYFITVLAFFILPHIAVLQVPVLSQQLTEGYTTKLALYVAFLPNIVLWLGYIIPYASQLWSVGVEEQFYVFWPWIFKLKHNPWPIVIGIIVGFLQLRIGADFLRSHWLSVEGRGVANQVYALAELTRVDNMAFGALGAYVIYYKRGWFYRYCLNPFVELSSLTGILLLMLHIIRVRYIENDLYGVFFLLLITNISCSDRSLLRLEGKLCTFLGNISYSVYMYQYLAIGILLFLFQKLGFAPVSGGVNFSLHVAAQVVSILFAYVSYKFLETPFLRLKKRFMLVKSTTGAKVGKALYKNP